MVEVVVAGSRLTLPVLPAESWLASVFATVAASLLLLPGHCGGGQHGRKPQKVKGIDSKIYARGEIRDYNAQVHTTVTLEAQPSLEDSPVYTVLTP